MASPQIAGLKKLNEIGQATVNDAEKFLEPYIQKFPDLYKNYDFENWLRFLTANKLIIQSGNIIEITELGRDFLFYLTDRRLIESKPW